MIENGVLYIVGLQISISEFLWTIISFFPFMFLLKKFLYQPVLSFMDERKARVEAGLAEGEKAKKALAEANEQLNIELSEKNGEARQLINEARSVAEKAKSEVLTEAHAKAEQLHKDVRQRVKDEEANAVNELDESMPELVSILAQQLLHSDEVSSETQLVKDCVSAAKE